ncbi:MAG: aminopeptidase [Gammaproteobacteria bacterium]|nr:aminopeptidase [Gammaproteobacteria bacterium]
MRALIRCSLLFAVLPLVYGCALPYYWQAASGHLDLLRKRTPIETVLEDPSQPPDVKQALRRVVDMRAFAVDQLGLPDNRSYRSYVDLDRSYVVWNVVAAEEFAVDPMQWCFPMVGCVSYRGYFSIDAAQAFAASLSERGFDTYVAGATAYSTLGYFADPVLNTMLAGGEHYIAGILFHELAHQKFYLRGDSDLNEAFATAVAQHGTAQWLAVNGSEQAVAAYRNRLQRQADFTVLAAAQRERLQAIYATDTADEAKRDAKQAAFAHMREEYEQLKLSWGGVTDYDNWFARPLNNAQLASVATYRRWLPGLIWYIDQHGLSSLYAQMTEIEDMSDDARDALLRSWLEAAQTTSTVARL